MFIPELKSLPNRTSFAERLPTPEPPVIKTIFEKIWEPTKTRASVTNAKFKPFNLTAIGEIITPTIAATIPDRGSHINISNSYPITLLVATPPKTAEVYVPIPTKTP